MINTEWLNRGSGSVVKTCLPVFQEENVGCMHWGLVNGKTQTDLGRGWRPGRPEPEVWQHDLFHGTHTAYDESELTLLRNCIRESHNMCRRRQIARLMADDLLANLKDSRKRLQKESEHCGV